MGRQRPSSPTDLKKGSRSSYLSTSSTLGVERMLDGMDDGLGACQGQYTWIEYGLDNCFLHYYRSCAYVLRVCMRLSLDNI